MKENNELPVNDGGGLYNNLGMIDSLIVDCNNLPSLLYAGRNIAFSSLLVQMVQKLDLLRKGVKHDTDALKAEIEELKKFQRGEENCSN